METVQLDVVRALTGGTVAPEEPDSENDEGIGPELNPNDILAELPNPVDNTLTKYFVTVSRRTGLRRLHAHFKCPVRSQRCLDAFDVTSIDETSFDVICRICKRRLQIEEGKHDSDSSSSTGDSSSTESDRAPEPQEEALD